MNKCPECGKAHRSNALKYQCYIRVENLWCHYVILCTGMTGGVTEENLLSYKTHTNIDFFREVKQRREDMKEYYNPILQDKL